MSNKRFRGALLRNLRQIRESQNLTRPQLATDTGIDPAFLWRLEKGENSAGYDTSRRIADRLNVTVDDLTREEAIA